MEPLDPRELPALQEYLASYNQQAELFSRQMAILEDGRMEAAAAIESLHSLHEARDGIVLLQIGGGASVRVEVQNPDAILLNIGSGVIVERTRDQAVEYLSDRMTEMDASAKKVSETLEKIQQQMAEIANRIEMIYQQQNQAQGTVSRPAPAAR